MGRTNANKRRRLRESNWRRLMILGVTFAASLLVILAQLQQVDAQGGANRGEKHNLPLPLPDTLAATAELSLSALPIPQTHTLPLTLARWQDSTGAGDYFAQVKPTPVGYLVWSQFPVKVYVERPIEHTLSSSNLKRFQDWINAVLQAVQEWSTFLPLEVVAQPTAADISILRSRPPLQASLNRETGQFNIPRARSAETLYKFYFRTAVGISEEILSQRFTIHLSPDQTAEYTLATARHELGHALGIWGHSPVETDTMYFSQVRNPPQISPRDINTLKQVYEQPTRLGWPLTVKSNPEQ